MHAPKTLKVWWKYFFTALYFKFLWFILDINFIPSFKDVILKQEGIDLQGEKPQEPRQFLKSTYTFGGQ